MEEKIPIHIDVDLCKGCGYCISFCTQGVFEQSGEINRRGVRPPKIKEEAACIRCGLCTLLCPDFALSMEKEEKDE